MNETIYIALISAGSALLGALIPTIISYLNNKEQNKFELKRDLLNNQKTAYKELMIALQNVISYQGNEQFRELQNASIILSIYGDNFSSNAMNDYYTQLVSASLEKRPHLTSDEHKSFQTEIINGIRTNLGLQKFDSFEIIGFRPN
ncbi:hypothetical protein ACFSJW_21995 [Flavobacterium artemisiae]|uniref:Uncharacterized protein n=1 Tax=Flavobacterium artemisiae TaxID=2126556 RepID=A0ABW4HB32_9FLAO